MADADQTPLPQHKDHSRDWRGNLYVYPVISRRSGGLSIGVNLNPDAACNFDCIYCQVDRSRDPRVREVDLAILEAELSGMIALAVGGRLYDDEALRSVPHELRGVRDIAFSGDGEPTTCKVFGESVELAGRLKHEAGLDQAKLVLITDACYLTRPNVAAALAVLDGHNGEVWAKLDAGTEDYFRLINRPNFPLTHVVENITAAAQVRPIVIQSMFLACDGRGPDRAEIEAYVGRLGEITAGGGRIACVQVYTVARRPADSRVTPLSNDEVDAIVEVVRAKTGLQAEPYYGAA